MEWSRVLLEAARIIWEWRHEIVKMETIYNGRFIFEARVHTDITWQCLEYYAEVAGALASQHVQLPGRSFAYIRRKSFGV